MNTKYIILQDDIIEIMHNELLKNKPFLIRFTNYSNENYEIRMNQNELINFASNILQYSEKKDFSSLWVDNDDTVA
jgi:hypothetical protein